ncbi:MAG: hypothetical protein IJA08_02255 [Clostridia bacterium]|nr:hypothetical protein [Clostridia bacterium]
MSENEKVPFKKKWENYWYYYKFHTWAAIFLIFVLVVSITQCASIVPADVTIDLVTSTAVTDSQIKLGGVFDDVMIDANNDGQKQLNIVTLYLSERREGEEDYAMMQKMMAELAAGEVTLFLFDKPNMEFYIKQDAFEPLGNLLDLTPYENTEGKLLRREGDDTVYGISLKGSQKLKELGFATDDLYAFIHFIPEKSKNDEKRMAQYKNAVAIMQELLK